MYTEYKFVSLLPGSRDGIFRNMARQEGVREGVQAWRAWGEAWVGGAGAGSSTLQREATQHYPDALGPGKHVWRTIGQG